MIITIVLDECRTRGNVYKWRTESKDNLLSLHTDIKDIDLIVTLGGDGTVLYASWLFQKQAPPIVAFHLGSLGFLTVFSFCQFQHLLTNSAITRLKDTKMTRRMRLVK